MITVSLVRAGEKTTRQAIFLPGVAYLRPNAACMV